MRQAGVDAEIRECAERSAALAAARSEAFDCILLDYHLPGTDGLELLRELRNSGVSLPVVALTGQGDEEVAVALMKAGAADYLNKNALTAERLERSLRYAVALHRAEEERRQLLEREQQARLEAQAANRAKDEFLATLSHELRTPLNAILGWSTLLASGQLDDADDASARSRSSSATRRLQAQLIDDLLDISRIVTGKLRLEFRAVALQAVVEAALESVRPAADAKGSRHRRRLDRIATSAILCDPDAAAAGASGTCCRNAIKFTPEGGRVSVSAARRQRHDSRDRRGHRQRHRAGVPASRVRPVPPGGCARRRARTAGWASASPSFVTSSSCTAEPWRAASDGVGKGATFTLTLPVAPGRTNDIVIDAIAGGGRTDRVAVAGRRPRAGRRQRAGCVRADCGAARRLGRAEVSTAGSAAEAIESIRRSRPDVLLSDIAMPGEDGYDLIRQVRALDDPQKGPLPAAALTAFANASDRARTLLAGYQAHLPKPVEAAELAAVVAALAGRTVKSVR